MEAHVMKDFVTCRERLSHRVKIRIMKKTAYLLGSCLIFTIYYMQNTIYSEVLDVITASC